MRLRKQKRATSTAGRCLKVPRVRVLTRKRRLRGRPAHVPTLKSRKNVELMTALGIRQEHIASIVGICPHVLRDNYRGELDLGKSKIAAQVGGNIVKQAIKDDFKAIPAAAFYASRQMGWSETTKVQNTGADGGPIEVKDVTAREIVAARIARIAENAK